MDNAERKKLKKGGGQFPLMMLANWGEGGGKQLRKLLCFSCSPLQIVNVWDVSSDFISNPSHS